MTRQEFFDKVGEIVEASEAAQRIFRGRNATRTPEMFDKWEAREDAIDTMIFALADELGLTAVVEGDDVDVDDRVI